MSLVSSWARCQDQDWAYRLAPYWVGYGSTQPSSPSKLPPTTTSGWQISTSFSRKASIDHVASFASLSFVETGDFIFFYFFPPTF